MRVIRRQGQFGTQVEVAGIGPAREPASIVLARVLERPIGRGGGLRDPLPGNARERPTRDHYATVALERTVRAWARKQADARGLGCSAFLGMIIEAAKEMTADELDQFLCGRLPGK